MFFGFDLKEIFMFPFKDEESRKHLLVGCLVGLAAIIVPILPMLVLFGYAVAIAKQVLNNESPHMIPWDDWAGLAKDGIKMFGIRMIFALPLLILVVPFVLSMTVFPIFLSTSNSSDVDTFLPIFMLLMFGGFCLIIPLSIPIALIAPAAEMYVVEKDDFAAGFRFREWWPIFRANISGFIAALAVSYIASFAFTIIIQILSITVILACLTFILLPLMTVYLTLVLYVTIAQAYRDGKVKLSQKEITPQAA